MHPIWWIWIFNLVIQVSIIIYTLLARIVWELLKLAFVLVKVLLYVLWVLAVWTGRGIRAAWRASVRAIRRRKQARKALAANSGELVIESAREDLAINKVERLEASK